MGVSQVVCLFLNDLSCLNVLCRGGVMASYTADVSWVCDDTDFLSNQYSRRHTVTFDGGVVLPASSSPHVVPLPMSDASAVDPEEMFVASLSSCHMLWFLTMALKRKFKVVSYRDSASGVMAKNGVGKMVMTVVTLHPQVVFEGDAPTREQLDALHHRAHDECFIANSVTTDVRCEPVY